MGIAEKLNKAKNTSWISEGLSDEEIECAIKSAKDTVRIINELRVKHSKFTERIDAEVEI